MMGCGSFLPLFLPGTASLNGSGQPRPSLASVLLSWHPQPRFCPRGSFALLTRVSPGPPKNALWRSSGASPFRLFVPREKEEAEKENYTMYQNQATLIGTLDKADDSCATNNPSLAGSSGSRSDSAAGQLTRGTS